MRPSRVSPPHQNEVMKTSYADRAVELLEKANADLDPELMSIPDTKNQLETYARARRLIDFGIAALAGKLDDAERLARVTGTSIGKAKETVATGKVLDDSRDLSLAMQGGAISLDQATEIARAERPPPGSAKDLLKIAKTESFHVPKDEARRTKSRPNTPGLAKRQRKAPGHQPRRRTGHGRHRPGMESRHRSNDHARAEAEAHARQACKEERQRGRAVRSDIWLMPTRSSRRIREGTEPSDSSWSSW